MVNEMVNSVEMAYSRTEFTIFLTNTILQSG